MKNYRVSLERRLPTGIVSSITIEQRATEADDAVAILEKQLPGWAVQDVATV